MATPTPPEPEAVRSRMRAEAPGAAERAFAAARTGTHRTLTALLCAGVTAPVIGAAMSADPLLAAALAAIGGVGSGPLANLTVRTIDRLRKSKEDEPTADEIEAALAADLDERAAEDTEEAAGLRRGMAALLKETGAIPAALEAIIRDANVDLLARLQAELERFDALAELAGSFPEVRASVIENLRISRGIAEGQERQGRDRAAEAAERRRFEEHSLQADRRMTEMLHTLLGRIGTSGGENIGQRSGFDGDSPYRGLYPFTENDSAVFFGRGHQVFKLLDHASECLDSSGMLALTAASGAGKTSLLRAGLFPAIGEGWWIDQPGSETWPLLYLTPGVDPLGALATALAQRIDGALATDVRRALSDEPERAHLLARQVLSQSGTGEAARMVLVVDQFEELFTLTDDETERRTFITAVASIARGGADAAPPQRAAGAERTGLVVIGVRSDCLDRCARHAELRPAVEDHLHFLAPMDYDQMRQAITGPAFATGLVFEDGLAEVILDDLRDSSSGADFSPAALPLLSQAMRKVWEGRKDGRLTRTAYDRFGGVSKALQASADEVYEALPEQRRATAERLFRRLAKVTRDGELVRTPLSRDGVSELGADAGAVVEAFAAARLIAVGEATVEIAHDALLRHWTKLSEWLEGDRESLAIRTALVEDAEEWESSGGDQAFLYRGSRLETAESERRQRWKDHPDRFEPLSDTALRFLAASHRREKRGRRIRRAATSVLASLLVLALVAVGIAVNANRELSEQRNQALSVQLATESAELRGTDGQLAQLLAAAAWRLSETDEAFTAMTNAADDLSIGQLRSDLLGTVQALEFSPDGSVLFTRSSNGAYALWSTDTWESESLGVIYGGGFADVEFSPDGEFMAANTGDGIRVWDVRSRTVELTLEPWDVFDLAISPDSSTLASVEGPWTSLWDLATGEELARFESDLTTEKVAFSADGETLFTGDEEGTVHQWDLATGEITSSQNLGSSLSMIWASPTMPGVAIACAYTGCHYLNSEGGWDLRTSLPAWTAKTSPDGSRLVSADGSDNVTVWDVETAEPLVDFLASEAIDFAFQPNGSLLAGGSDIGVQLWGLERATPASRPLPGSDRSGFELVSLKYSSEAPRLVGTGWEATGVWDLSSEPRKGGELLGMYPNHAGGVTAVSPDGELVATAPWGQRLDEFDIWNPATGEVLATMDGHERTVGDLEFSPDGTVLASTEGQKSGRDSPDTGEVRLWDVATGEEILRLEPHQGGASVIDFSSDGTTLATADGFGLVRLWNVVTGELEATLRGNNSDVYALEFSHDDTRLIATTDLGLSSWEVPSGAHTRLAEDLKSEMNSDLLFGFSPDDRYAGLVVVRGLRIWDLERDVAAAELPVSSFVYGVDFAPGEWHVAVGSESGIRVVDVGFLTDPYAAVCEEAGRELTSAEWETYLPDIDPDDLEVC